MASEVSEMGLGDKVVMKFARKLACNDQASRSRGIKQLKIFLTHVPEDVDEVMLLRLWKGLHFCMWMADKPLFQEELAGRMADLVHTFSSKVVSIRFCAAFLHLEVLEWHLIDSLRIDKFMMLVRLVTREGLLVLKSTGWRQDLTAIFLLAIPPLCRMGESKGLLFHLLSFLPTELQSMIVQDVEQQTGQKEFMKDLIVTFIKIISTTHDEYIAKEVKKSVLYTLIKPVFLVDMEWYGESVMAAASEASCHNRKILFTLVRQIKEVKQQNKKVVKMMKNELKRKRGDDEDDEWCRDVQGGVERLMTYEMKMMDNKKKKRLLDEEDENDEDGDGDEDEDDDNGVDMGGDDSDDVENGAEDSGEDGVSDDDNGVDMGGDDSDDVENGAEDSGEDGVSDDDNGVDMSGDDSDDVENGAEDSGEDGVSDDGGAVEEDETVSEQINNETNIKKKKKTIISNGFLSNEDEDADDDYVEVDDEEDDDDEEEADEEEADEELEKDLKVFLDIICNNDSVLSKEDDVKVDEDVEIDDDDVDDIEADGEDDDDLERDINGFLDMEAADDEFDDDDDDEEEDEEEDEENKDDDFDEKVKVEKKREVVERGEKAFLADNLQNSEKKSVVFNRKCLSKRFHKNSKVTPKFDPKSQPLRSALKSTPSTPTDTLKTILFSPTKTPKTTLSKSTKTTPTKPSKASPSTLIRPSPTSSNGKKFGKKNKGRQLVR